MFNDKHLSWNWEQALDMVATSKSLGFPMMAGSGLSVTWRMPALDLPYGAKVKPPRQIILMMTVVPSSSHKIGAALSQASLRGRWKRVW